MQVRLLLFRGRLWGQPAARLEWLLPVNCLGASVFVCSIFSHCDPAGGRAGADAAGLCQCVGSNCHAHGPVKATTTRVVTQVHTKEYHALLLNAPAL